MNELFLESSEGTIPKEDSNLSEIFKNVYLNVRNQYLNKNPDYFNWWIPKFKSYAFAAGGIVEKIWNDLVAGTPPPPFFFANVFVLS